MHNHSQGTHAGQHASRRDFFQQLFGATLAGASVLEAGFFRAAWARTQSRTASDRARCARR